MVFSRFPFEVKAGAARTLARGCCDLAPKLDARQKMEDWRRDYNEVRPHSAIGNKAVKAQEPVRVQAFGSELAVEGFDEAIVRRLAGT
nr:integrase core domain-containing protein [Bradyrhizobium canariense]